MDDEDIKTARAVLDVMSTEAEKAERVLCKIASRIASSDEGLSLALTSQARALRAAAEDALKLIDILRTKTST